MDTDAVKWVSALFLLILTFFFAALPLCWRRSNRRILSLLSCCGGGVFLGTCLLHLLPDVQEQMLKICERLHWDPSYPLAEFLLAFGFLIVLIIEQIVLACRQPDDEELPILSHQHSHGSVGDGNYGAVADSVVPTESEVSFHEDPSSHSILRSALMVFALSLHSVFEGLAIGLQKSSQDVLRIFGAVMIHKSIIAFTLGLNLMHSRFTKCSMIKCVILFSVMSPIGAAAGTLISDLGTGLSLMLTDGILQGLATGTFVYVTFFEVLPHELNAREDKLLKVMCLIFGFSIVSLLVVYFPG